MKCRHQQLHSCFLLTLSLVHPVDAIAPDGILMVMSTDLCQESSQGHQKAECFVPYMLRLLLKIITNRLRAEAGGRSYG